MNCVVITGSGKSTLGMMAAHYILWPHRNEYNKMISVLQLNRIANPCDIIRSLPTSCDQIIILRAGERIQGIGVVGFCAGTCRSKLQTQQTVCMIMLLKPTLTSPDIRISFAGEDKP